MASNAAVVFDILADDRTAATFAKVAAEASLLGRHIDKAFRSVGGPNVTRDVEKVFSGLGNDAGSVFGKEMSSGLSKQATSVGQDFSASGPVGGAILAAAAVFAVEVLSPVIAGAISAAITLGVGGAFIALGAYVLRNNKKIVGAFDKLKHDISSTLQGAAQPLVGPFVDALNAVDNFVKGEGPTLKEIFGNLGPAIVPFTNAILGFTKALTPGIVALSQTFAQVFTDPNFASSMKSIGNSISGIFEEVSKHPQLILDFFQALGKGVAVVAFLLNNFIRFAQLVADDVRRAKTGIELAWYEIEIAFIDAMEGIVRNWYGTIRSIVDAGAALPGPLGEPFRLIQSKFDKTTDGMLASMEKAKQGIFKKIGELPTDHNIKVTANAVGFGAIKSALAGLHDKTVNITFAATAIGAAAAQAVAGALHHRAAGGVVGVGETTLVGEHGPEIVQLPAGSRVYPTGTGPAVRPVGAGGPGVVELHLHGSLANLVTDVRAFVRGKGGNVQVVLGGHA